MIIQGILAPIVSIVTKELMAFCSVPDFPRFTAKIENTSTPIGRDAILDCFVDNAENFMVSRFVELLFSCLGCAHSS